MKLFLFVSLLAATSLSAAGTLICDGTVNSGSPAHAELVFKADRTIEGYVADDQDFEGVQLGKEVHKFGKTFNLLSINDGGGGYGEFTYGYINLNYESQTADLIVQTRSCSESGCSKVDTYNYGCVTEAGGL